MDWVKRNLGLVIGSAVAVGLLLFSGYYLYSNSKKNNDAREQLEAEYNELKRLSNLNPHPGKRDVDNIRLAKQQTEGLLQFMQRVGERFEPIAAIPPTAEVTGEEFSASLRYTIDQLNRQARVSSVIVPTNYNFSFEAEKRLVKFAPGSLNPLAVQVGEVKAISEVLFAAKVNKLKGLRRERVSPDDRAGPKSDYLTGASVTNDLAVISPYEISFESFSAELAEVISGFANSPHGIVIKGMNIRPAKAVTSPTSRYGGESFGGRAPIYANPGAAAYGAAGEAEAYAPAPQASRFGGEEGMGGYGGGTRGQIRRPEFRRPTFGNAQVGGQPGAYGRVPTQPYRQPTPQAYAQPRAATAAAATSSQTLIDEQPLGVTMVVEVIKLLPLQEE